MGENATNTFSEIGEIDKVIRYLKENKIFHNDFINIFLDIGAHKGQAAKAFYKNFVIYPDKIHLIEPDLILFENIKDLIFDKTLERFYVHNLAFSDKDKMGVLKSFSHYKLPYYGMDLTKINTLHERDYEAVIPKLYEVELTRGETFMKKFNLETIDFCKIDAEGHSYEILEGFGKAISNIKCIFLETENFEVWKGQKYTNDIDDFLTKNNFNLEWQTTERIIWAGEGKYQNNQLWINKKMHEPK